MSEKNSRQEKRGWTESGGEKNEHREGDEWEFNGLRKTGMNKKEENERWQGGCEEGLGEILAETERGERTKRQGGKWKKG